MSDPLAFFITFTCHGTWLNGDERGSVDEGHNAFATPVLPADSDRHARAESALVTSPYLLDEPRRRIALSAIREICGRKGWALHAAHVRTNHIHLIVSASGSPERVMNDVKAAISRRLNQAFPHEQGLVRWTRHGSTRYLWSEEVVAEKVHYVLHEQGKPLEHYPNQAACQSRARSEAAGRAE